MAKKSTVWRALGLLATVFFPFLLPVEGIGMGVGMGVGAAEARTLASSAAPTGAAAQLLQLSQLTPPGLSAGAAATLLASFGPASLLGMPSLGGLPSSAAGVSPGAAASCLLLPWPPIPLVTSVVLDTGDLAQLAEFSAQLSSLPEQSQQQTACLYALLTDDSSDGGAARLALTTSLSQMLPYPLAAQQQLLGTYYQAVAASQAALALEGAMVESVAVEESLASSSLNSLSMITQALTNAQSALSLAESEDKATTGEVALSSALWQLSTESGGGSLPFVVNPDVSSVTCYLAPSGSSYKTEAQLVFLQTANIATPQTCLDYQASPTSSPEVLAVTLTSGVLNGALGDILSCSASLENLDGITPTLSYDWQQGSGGSGESSWVSIVSGGVPTLLVSAAMSGQSIRCVVTATALSPFASDVSAPAASSVLLLPLQTSPQSTALITPGGGGVYNASNFGAAAGANDSAPGIQAAINAACNQSNGVGHPPVFLPSGNYSISAPLLINCNNLEFYGASRSATIITPSFQGPAILLNPPGNVVNLTLADPLLPSANLGMSSSFYGNSAQLVLSEAPSVSVGGLSSFTAEAEFSWTSGSESNIVGSYGQLGTGGGPVPYGSSAFSIGIDSYLPYGALMVGGVNYFLSADFSVTPGVAHHMALSYDGSTIRYFVDGVMVDSAAASGPVNQGTFEDISLGPLTYGLEGSLIQFGLGGYIDFVRLSNTARYTTNFTPPSEKPIPDTSTLALENFDQTLPGLALLYTGDSSSFWLPVHRNYTSSNQAIPFLGGVKLHNFTIDGGMGIFGWLAVKSQLYQIDCQNCDYGFFMAGSSWESHFDDLSAEAGSSRGRFGLYSTVANGSEFNNITLSGQLMPMVIVGSSNQIMSNVTITPSNFDSLFGLYTEATSSLVTNLKINASGSSSSWLASIMTIQPWAKFQLQNSQVGNMGAGIPLLVEGGAGALVEGSTFTNTASSTAVIYVAPSTQKPNIIVASNKDSSSPWTNDSGAVMLPAPDVFVLPSVASLAAYSGASQVVSGLVSAASVFDVTLFGADASGNNDSAPAIQAAIDAACAFNLSGGLTTSATVFFPYGNYSTQTPAQVYCNNLSIQGVGMDSSVLSLAAGGPALLLSPAALSLPLGPALVGSGSSLQLAGTANQLASEGLGSASGGVSSEEGGSGGSFRGDYWLNLRDAPAGDIAGLSAFTAEAFIELTDWPSQAGSYWGILQSHGCLGNQAALGLPGCSAAFQLGVGGANISGSSGSGVFAQLVATLNLSSGVVSLVGGALSMGVPHHLALSYDGSSVRLFLDGQLAASQTASGSLVQGEQEDVTVGAQTDGFDYAVSAPAIPGFIDAVQLSSTARYTTNFTPPQTKPEPDGSTLIALDFAANTSATTLGIAPSSSSGVYYFPLHYDASAASTPATISGITVSAMSFNHSSLFAQNTSGAHFEQLNFVYNDLGLILSGQNNSVVMNEVDVLGGGRSRYGIVEERSSGGVHHNVAVNYQQMNLVDCGGTGQIFEDLFVTSGTADISAGFFSTSLIASSDSFSGLYFDNEVASPSWMGDMVIWNPPTPGVGIFKGEIDAPLFAEAPNVSLKIDGGRQLGGAVVFDGVSFGLSAQTPEAINAVTSPTTTSNSSFFDSLLLLRGLQNNGGVPYSNVTTLDIIGL